MGLNSQVTTTSSPLMAQEGLLLMPTHLARTLVEMLTLMRMKPGLKPQRVGN